ncbi:MAG: DUF4959 domain-containing protein [Prevotellaceae bacterium]|jgi:hypothetical protein|nr:DUF4959 domain-containing protein [Prevotellaceae bacterium]
MKRKNIRYINIYIFIMLIFAACAKEIEHEPIGSGNGAAPGQVKNVNVENISGGAILTYDLPDNVDLQYVKAVYTSNNIQRESRASAYVKTLKIEGFGTTDERTIQLYAVNRMEKASSPVDVTIKPLTPSVLLVRRSLDEQVDFGGFVVSFENVNKTDIAINILVKDSIEDRFNEYDATYTSIERGVFSVRGLPNRENDFGIYVVDRWDNYSDTLFFRLTPWREDNLLKSGFRARTVHGDVGWNFHSGAPEKAWDNDVSQWNFAHTDFPAEFPHRFTMDLGVDVKLSRFKFWQRPGDDVLYQHGAPKVYKIYGRPDDPGSGNAGDIFDGWTLLMQCNSFKPSGLPLGQNSGEDVEFAALGEEFSFPRDVPVVRYLRFEMLESWSGMKCSTIGELGFWGEIQL